MIRIVVCIKRHEGSLDPLALVIEMIRGSPKDNEKEATDIDEGSAKRFSFLSENTAEQFSFPVRSSGPEF